MYIDKNFHFFAKYISEFNINWKITHCGISNPIQSLN